MLFVFLGATGLRFGEAFGLEIDKHISDDFSTLHIRQKVWSGSVQPFLKTESGVRDIDLHSSIAAMLKKFVGDRTSGFLFRSKSWTPAFAIERLETFLTPASDEVAATEIGCSRISAFPRDVAEEAARARRLDSLLARPRQ